MASSENSQNWRKKEHSYVAQSKSEEHSSESGINGNWRSERDEDLRSGRDENKGFGSDENWRTRQNKNWKKEGKFELSKIKEEYSVNQIHGCWKILCERNKEYNEVWKIALELHSEQARLFPVPPRIWDYGCYSATVFIECYTSPLSDKEHIKKAADAIREKVFFPFIMHYIEAPILPKKCHKYMHTPEREFYELEDKAWKSALIENNREDALSSEVSTVEKSRLIEIKPSGILAINDIQTSSYEISLPSKVTDKDYIYFPPTKEAIEKMRLTNGGKWMIYTRYDLSKHDDIWTALISLYKEGILVGLKSSTAVITEAERFMGEKVIHCYTVNSDDIRDVKIAVDKIRSVLSYNYVIYYKTNVSSETGRYAIEGCYSVSEYMDTVKGTLYKRDQFRRFSLAEL